MFIEQIQMKVKKQMIILLVMLFLSCFSETFKNKENIPATSYKHFKIMSYQELKDKSAELLKKNQKTTAINYVERMLELTKELNEIRELRLLLANLYFETEDYCLAQKKCAEFAQYYPNHPQAEHASARAIEASFMQSLSPDRDPTALHETIDLANEFLKNNNFIERRDLVKSLKKEAQVKLVCKEINTIEFYLKQNNTKAVIKRIEFIKREFKELINDGILKIEPIQEYLDAVTSKNVLGIKKAQEELHKCYSGTCSLSHDKKLSTKTINPEETLKRRRTIDYFLVP